MWDKGEELGNDFLGRRCQSKGKDIGVCNDNVYLIIVISEKRSWCRK